MKQEQKQGRRNQIGAWGEGIAAKYLQKQGFAVLDRNYLKKWGEIDIVARETTQNGQIVHFVEVKTVSYETRAALERAVSCGTWRPEENVHHKKLQRLHRAIESWLLEKKSDAEWQIDVLTVRVVPCEKYATVKYLPNTIVD